MKQLLDWFYNMYSNDNFLAAKPTKESFYYDKNRQAPSVNDTKDRYGDGVILATPFTDNVNDCICFIVTQPNKNYLKMTPTYTTWHDLLKSNIAKELKAPNPTLQKAEQQNAIHIDKTGQPYVKINKPEVINGTYNHLNYQIRCSVKIASIISFLKLLTFLSLEEK